MALAPLVFTSHPQYLRFGGEGLKPRVTLGAPLRPEPLAETWELSDHPGHASVVSAGPMAGRTLRELMQDHGPELLGLAPPLADGRFPLMVRLLDVRENLPPAVHPDFRQAREMGLTEGGKVEVAVVLESDPGALFHHAGSAPWGEAELRRASKDCGAFQVMQGTAVAPGQAYLVPPGVPHAWGAGSLVYEVHTTSNAIFALDWMDWDNKDDERRASDVAKARAVLAAAPESGLELTPGAERREGAATVTPLCTGPLFSLERVRAEASFPLCGEGFAAWTLVDGAGTIRTEGGEACRIEAFRTFLVPASCIPAHFEPEGPCQLLRAFLTPEQARTLGREALR